jgi:nitrogen regulatory protein PII
VGDYRVEFIPKIKLEMIVGDNDAAKVVELIQKVCSTGKVGDGKIFISTVDDAIRIRTKEKGAKAI